MTSCNVRDSFSVLGPQLVHFIFFDCNPYNDSIRHPKPIADICSIHCRVSGVSTSCGTLLCTLPRGIWYYILVYTLGGFNYWIFHHFLTNSRIIFPIISPVFTEVGSRKYCRCCPLLILRFSLYTI